MRNGRRKLEDFLYQDDFDCGDGGDYVTDVYDLDEPRCPRCGSTSWEYCRLGENSRIAFCSDCPSEQKKTH